MFNNRINRRKADRELLKQYEDMRNERRRPWLEVVAYAAKGVVYAGLFPVFFIPQSIRLTYLTCWMVFAGLYIVTMFVLMVRWQPHGKRLRGLAIVVGFVITAVLMLIGFNWLMERW
ncbi:MAG TPA: hypothetical protein VFI84_02440, partial [Candidatus Saccharimonadales bacterium]|nr:hypothetical protein [Candidatus Saccharimonadales bacterium]